MADVSDTISSSIAKFDLAHPDLLTPEGNHKLNDRWVLWAHDEGKGWSAQDYTKMAVIATVEDFWNVFNGLPSLNYKDMWFLMREGIPPLWEDPINLEGGSFKFRVAGSAVDNTWLTLALHLVTENMCLNVMDAQTISGMGLSPKKNNFATISVWNLDSSNTAHSQFPKNIDGIDFAMSRYDTHRKLAHKYTQRYNECP